ncbi:MAG: ABC transporter permease [Pseudomonadota bacterium]
MKRWTRIGGILTKELKQLGRDRLSFALIASMPIMQLLLFGYAINTDVRYLKTMVVDAAGSHTSQALIQAVAETQVVEIIGFVATPQELEAALRRGEIAMGIAIPHDVDRRLERGDRPAAQVMVDAADPTLLGVARQLSGMPNTFAATTAARQADIFETRAYYNPEGRSAVNIVPGLLGVILTMTMVMFTAVAIVKETERGNLEFLINTPVSNGELMLGKVLPYVGVGLLQVSLLIGIGRWLFDVPVRGSMGDLYLASLLFIAANLSLGLLISTLVSTQFQAMQATFFLLLPSILLSGFMFPFDGMPVFAQWLAETLPMTHYLRLVRGIMLREAGLVELLPSAMALGACLLVGMVLATLRFKKRLD